MDLIGIPCYCQFCQQQGHSNPKCHAWQLAEEWAGRPLPMATPAEANKFIIKQAMAHTTAMAQVATISKKTDFQPTVSQGSKQPGQDKPPAKKATLLKKNQ